MKSLRDAFTRADIILLSLGLAGIAAHLFLLPYVHPDAAPPYPLNKEEILDRAKGFVYNQGYSVSGYDWTIAPIRSVRLLDSLQEKTQDQTLYDILKNPDFDNLPAYAWETIARKKSLTDEEDDRIRINLSQAGDVWNLETKTTEQIAPVREALLQSPRLQDRLAAAPDSVSTEDLVGRFWAIMLNPRFPRPPPSPADSLAFRGLGVEDAKAIARYYLDKSLLRLYDLQADSVMRPEDAESDVARVMFSGIEATSGLSVKADIDITTAGVLRAINTTYEPDPEPENTNSNGIELDFTSGSIADTLGFIAYLLLGLFTFILFLRRLNARLIDVKGALQDAIWGGLFASLAAGNAVGWQIYQESSTALSGLLTVIGTMIIAGSAGAFGVFIISCATDSIARAVWPQRLATLTLARNIRFFNIPMGLSLVRSVGLAGVFLGLTTLFMYLPGIVFAIPGEHLAGFNQFSLFIDLITVNGLFGMLTCMMVLLSFGATLYSQRPSSRLVITAVTLLAAILQLGPLKLAPAMLQWLLSGSIGLLLILSLLRFDYFSCFGGFTLYTLLWYVAPHWLMPAAEAQLDVVLAFSLIPTILALGLVGLIRGKDVDGVDQFLPAYLREMAQQERLRSELEIARQVQASLLPRRMPTMESIDIAAMCLPAQEVGGDYFDFIRLDKNRLALIIGDVSGKGIQAGFFMTLTKGFIHAVCESEESPAKVLTHVNRLFCKNVPRGTFISLIYGIFDTENNTFTFARAGHDPLLYASANLDTPVFYRPHGMAIGLTPEYTFERTIEDETIALLNGDLLVFYTDGVTEAVNPKMEQFGVDRLAQKIEQAGLKTSARQVLQEVSEYIQTFVQSAGRVDDMTMIVVRVAPPQDIPSATEISPESKSWLAHEI